MRISVGIPVYDSKLPCQLASCLLAETLIAHKSGIDMTVRFLPSCTNLAMGRNHIVKWFMDSEDEKLIFVDADVTFEPGSIVRLAKHPADFVGGAYPLKLSEESYPIAWIENNELWANEHGLLEVAMVPTGFLSLTRKVFDTFREGYPGREYQHRDNVNYCYFQIPFLDGALFTEDAYFCKEWRELGGKVYLDPELTLTHWDMINPYKGHIGHWLKRINGLEAVS